MEEHDKFSSYLFLYNLRNQLNFDENSLSKLQKIDFFKMLKDHFGEIKENGIHKSIIRDSYTIYFGWHGEPESGVEVSIIGKDAILELMKFGEKNGLTVAIPNKMKLINLLSLKELGFKNLGDFLSKRHLLN